MKIQIRPIGNKKNFLFRYTVNFWNKMHKSKMRIEKRGFVHDLNGRKSKIIGAILREGIPEKIKRNYVVAVQL